MPVLNFNVTYPDFQLGQTMNPDEFDINFSDLVIRCNQLIDIVNLLEIDVATLKTDIAILQINHITLEARVTTLEIV